MTNREREPTPGREHGGESTDEDSFHDTMNDDTDELERVESSVSWKTGTELLEAAK